MEKRLNEWTAHTSCGLDRFVIRCLLPLFLSRFRTEVSNTIGSTTLTVAQLNERIVALEAENAHLTRTKAKIDPPPKYGGSKGELSRFLT